MNAMIKHYWFWGHSGFHRVGAPPPPPNMLCINFPSPESGLIPTFIIPMINISMGCIIPLPTQQKIVLNLACSIDYRTLVTTTTVGWVLNARFLWFQISTKRIYIKHDHTPFAQACMLMIVNIHAFLISCVFDLLACMYVQLSIVKNEFSSILQAHANCQPANTQAAKSNCICRSVAE